MHARTRGQLSQDPYFPISALNGPVLSPGNMAHLCHLWLTITAQPPSGTPYYTRMGLPALTRALENTPEVAGDR
jgi:hypothetical protein